METRYTTTILQDIYTLESRTLELAGDYIAYAAKEVKDKAHGFLRGVSYILREKEDQLQEQEGLVARLA